MSEQGKIPPNAVDLECLVLGALMIERPALGIIMPIMSAEMFYEIAHQRIYLAIQSLYTADKPVDIATVTHWLRGKGWLESVGGAYYVSQLTSSVASSANAEYHARIIAQKFIQRELIRVTGDIYAKAFSDKVDVLELLDEFSMAAEKIASNICTTSNVPVDELMAQSIERIKTIKSGNGNTGLLTSFRAFDDMHGGYMPGDLIIIAARPAMGKSGLALCEAVNMVKQGKQVAFFSLEMGGGQLIDRLLASETDIYLQRFKMADMDDRHIAKLTECRKQWSGRGLHIFDNVYSLNGIRAHCRRLKETTGLDAIYVDYIQLVENRVAGGNREQEVAGVSRSFKQMARAHGCPVIALAQLNRSVETRGGTKRPNLSDLRESGAIEQDADMVQFLYRPEYYGVEVDDSSGLHTKGLALRIIAKNRSGSLCDVPMKFDGAVTRFTDWDDRKEHEPMAFPTRLKPNANFYEKDSTDDQPF